MSGARPNAVRAARYAVLAIAVFALVATTYVPWPNYASECEKDSDCVIAHDTAHIGPGQRWVPLSDGGQCFASRGFSRRYFNESVCLVELGYPPRGGCADRLPDVVGCRADEWPAESAICEQSYCRVKLQDGGLW